MSVGGDVAAQQEIDRLAGELIHWNRYLCWLHLNVDLSDSE